MLKTKCLLLVFLFLLIGCSPKSKTAPIESLVLAHNPSQPTYLLVVEPIKFVAPMPRKLYESLCVDFNKPSGPYSSRTNYCDGDLAYIDVPKIGNLPAMKSVVYTGEKSILGTGPKELAQMLTSELSGVGNFQIFSSESAARKFFKKSKNKDNLRGPFLVRGLITEIEADTEADQKGIKTTGVSGIAGPASMLGPIGIPVALAGTAASLFQGASSDTVIGYVRVDIALINSNTRRYIQSFPVAGSFMEKRSKMEWSIGLEEKKDFSTVLVSNATRAAFSSASREIHKRLTSGGI